MTIFLLVILTFALCYMYTKSVYHIDPLEYIEEKIKDYLGMNW